MILPRNSNKKIWFDFTNPPHVNQFLPLIRHLGKTNEIYCSARQFVETTELLNKYGIPFTVFGGHGGKSKIRKIVRMFQRNIRLALSIPKFDLSISSNYEAPLISWLTRRKSIVFDDNDISPNWLYAPFVTKVFSPRFINIEKMLSYGIKKEKLFLYEGFKEDIYLADYEPDPDFLNNLPFREFVTVRPENLNASYVSGNKSIVPELIERLIKNGYNILYLPRYEMDRSYIIPNNRLFIPGSPLNGLDVCYYSTAVLTGAGTFAREAAQLGVPAVSFFAGVEFLNVDKVMFEQKKVFFSREPLEIITYLKKSNRKDFDIQKSIAVKSEVISGIEELL